ncbi:MAG: malto-oligosyltrehalose trehalohydrolase [Acidobacteriaceae bacterium]|nr:malto-oligosyltrehalose trehalohydrolase [Acidobacteriaceae bacterium]
MSKLQSTTLAAGANNAFVRTLPVGAELQADRTGTHFRVWAPGHSSVSVVFEDGRAAVPLFVEGNGYFSGFSAEVSAAVHYKYKLDQEEACPDPASRFQPTGPHGFSEVVDPHAFAWSDSEWRSVKLAHQVVYELHLGTFTNAGTWLTAAEKLQHLHDTGVTLIEVMPVADFPGKFGWGYDGVQPYAPASIYGIPDHMRAFVDQAHQWGLGVILDVVYNHLGPDGNYLPKFSPFYLTDKYKTDWGQAINFDGPESGPVREFFRENAAYWIREFHLDGLRLDATQDIQDESKPHIITEIGEAARKAAGARSIILIGENEPQDTRLIRPVQEGGSGLDALWNDDFHHSAMVALTGKSEAYYTDYRGKPQEFVSAMKYGYLYQGQWYRWQKKRRGRSNLGLSRAAMVTFIQNHDQVANSARGQRVQELSAPGVLKAITALMLLGPGTPMLFQGQEFAASSPFLFFADHEPELAKLIRAGRLEFLEQWRSLQLPEMQKCLADPCSEETFQRSKLDFSEVNKHAEQYLFHQDLLRLRRKDPVFSRQGEDGIDGAVLSESALVLRYFSPDFLHDRLLVVNLGTDLELNPAPEPLLAPPHGTQWKELWSSDDARYGGCGTAPVDSSSENWKIPGHAAVVLCPLR